MRRIVLRRIVQSPLSLTIQTRQSLPVLLNQLTHLTSIDITLCRTELETNLAITEDWIRDETSLQNFLFTVDEENQRIGLWIERLTT